MNAGGILLILAGVLVLCQVLGGAALMRLNLIEGMYLHADDVGD